MIGQAAADAQKIGKLFSVVENYKILNNYSQPFKQSTTDEIVGFVAALTKVGFIKRNDISYTTSFCSDDSRATGGAAGDQTQQNLQQIQYCGATGTGARIPPFNVHTAAAKWTGKNVTKYLNLQSSFRYVNWRSLMRKLFGGAEVQSSQLFLVHFPSFLRQLDRMVSLFGVRFVKCEVRLHWVQRTEQHLAALADHFHEQFAGG